ncbi:MAG: HAD-IA family hydrolase [Dehalococcoidales bacterium]|nr:HAD-IA family hydrolase [Dehalococcoidales bacterium]
MIKAVFFDLYQTLVRYEPPRENIESDILKDFGIEVSPDALRRPIVVADEFIYNEIARRPLSDRSTEEKMALYVQYQGILLKEAGIEYDRKILPPLLGAMQKSRMDLVLFDDVAPLLDDLKGKGLTLGLISNIEQDMTETLTGLKLTSWLEIIVTSQDVASGKPGPEIFQEALRRAGVAPEESIYVGDQYQVDVVGSRGAGMKAVLVDRNDYYDDDIDCIKISNLNTVVDYL